ncbi:MAG: site-specific DNA-methyltransferase [Candidatus Aenigmatarchaeota archaeon]
MTKEKKFYEKLRDIFIGAKVEGQGGFINLMKIKSKYYQKIESYLKADIEDALQKYPNFRDELFDKLYTFFNRYFSENGSIYFNSTPFHNNIYEKVYTDNRDVILFWKTRMLYYVKTDRIFRSMPVELDGKKFYFDALTVENKKANEKRELIYELKEVREDKTVVFNVIYSERGRTTKTEDILRELRKKGITDIKEEDLERAFRVFEKQSEVDYFINKNAKQFLKEQFDLWLYQYLTDINTEWTHERIEQIQILKKIAYKLIDFVSQFEDELVKIWNKPKFVRNSNYVITLDRIANKEDGLSIIEKLKTHKGWNEQVKEWIELGILGSEPDALIENNQLKRQYQYLPIDTKYFKDLEIEILSLFDNLDEELDGWLIKSENYQALNTILPKFKGKVKAIYIDPPYNTGSDEFLYKDKYKHSSWLTMMENRLQLAREFLKEDGVIFVSIASNLGQYNEYHRLGLLLEEIMDKRIVDLIWKRRSGSGSYVISGATEVHEYIMCYGKEKADLFKNLLPREKIKEFNNRDEVGIFKWHDLVINQYTKDERPNLFYGVVYNFIEDYLDFEKSEKDINPDSEIIIYPSKSGKSVWTMTKKSMQEVYNRGVIKVIKDKKGNYKIKIKKYLFNKDELINGYPIKSILNDEDLPWEIGTTAHATKELNDLLPSVSFDTVKPVNLIKTLLYVSTLKNDIVLDFFAGSGTTAHAVMKLNKEDGGKRKFILIEMADYFYSIILPRIKKLAYSIGWINNNPVLNDSNGYSLFVKYYELEQYEDTLSMLVYEDNEPLFVKNNIYNQYIFMPDKKLTETVLVDFEQNDIDVNFDKIFPFIDLAESLSNLRGKRIKKYHKNLLYFEDEVIDLNRLNTKDIVNFIYWE